ncbi:MAG: hypothetical protein ACOC2D_14035, partial [Spirochaetota bacterium]
RESLVVDGSTPAASEPAASGSEPAAGESAGPGHGRVMRDDHGETGAPASAGSASGPSIHHPETDDHHPITPPPARGLSSEQAAEIILRIRPSRLALSSALEKATRWAFADSELHVIFESEYPANAARGEEEVIRNAAADVLGKPVLVRIQVDEQRVADQAKEQAENDSRVDTVKRVFRGEIVDG